MRILKYEKIGSTQIIAREFAELADDMTVVVADDQTEGRGRYGREWVSGVGGLWATWILKKQIPIVKLPFLALSVGYHLHGCILKNGVEARLKYPNDILVGDKKLIGILCNSCIQGNTHKHSLVGVGMNINNIPPPEGTSLENIFGKKINVSEVLQDVGVAIERARNDLSKLEPAEIINNLKDVDCLELPLDNNFKMI